MKFIKKFRQWNERLGRGWFAFWLLAFLSVVPVVSLAPPMGAILYVLLLLWLLLAIMRTKLPLTLLLIGALFMAERPARVEAQDTNKPQPESVPCGVIIAVVVIVVGGIVIYKIIRFCKNKFPQPPPPPPPATNAPPATNDPPQNPTASLANLRPSNIPTGYDVSAAGWVDNSQPANPVPFLVFIPLQFNGSTNLADWSPACSVNLWLSSNSLVGVVYDAGSNAVATNWARGNPFDTNACMTNSLNFPLGGRKQFFLRDW